MGHCSANGQIIGWRSSLQQTLLWDIAPPMDFPNGLLTATTPRGYPRNIQQNTLWISRTIYWRSNIQHVTLTLWDVAPPMENYRLTEPLRVQQGYLLDIALSMDTKL